MANAVDSRASARIARTTELLNVVERDHQAQISSYKRFTLIIIVALALVLVLLAVAVFYLRKQLTKVSALKERLQDAGHTKDVYISQFMTLCSTYMDRLRDFSKLVNRKISAGHADELLALTKSGKFIDEQSRSTPCSSLKRISPLIHRVLLRRRCASWPSCAWESTTPAA